MRPTNHLPPARPPRHPSAPQETPAESANPLHGCRRTARSGGNQTLETTLRLCDLRRLRPNRNDSGVRQFRGKRIRAGSMGLPAPGVPLHVIDDGGKECNVGIEGDIAILVDGSAKQDSFFGFFAGYLSENGSLDRRTHASGDGKIWYRTGERATRDAEGYFWFVGRNDDVINSAGYRIGPFEVESTLEKHPAVLESAVVSSPDPHRSEVVKAFVVLTAEYRDGDSSTTNTTTTSSTTTATTTSATTNTTPTTLTTTNLIKELQDFCKRNAAPYKYPRKIEFVGPDFLPKTISGKIKRSELKGMEWSGCAKEEDGKTRVSKL